MSLRVAWPQSDIRMLAPLLVTTVTPTDEEPTSWYSIPFGQSTFLVAGATPLECARPA
jgi:hypothetical protein